MGSGCATQLPPELDYTHHVMEVEEREEEQEETASVAACRHSAAAQLVQRQIQPGHKCKWQMLGSTTTL